jgi:predicted dehydrogenase
MLLRFAAGELIDDATGLVSISMTEGPVYENRLELHGTEGSMLIGPNGELSVAGLKDKQRRVIDVDLGEPVAGVPDTGFSRAFMSFAPKIVDALREERTQIDHAATFDDGLLVQRVLDAARGSDRSGCVSK